MTTAMQAQAFHLPVRVVPQADNYDVVLTALTPVSHHDAAVQDGSNRLLFNRQKQLVHDVPVSLWPTQAQIDALVLGNPIPAGLWELFSELTFPEFCAAALVRAFCDLYTSREGVGLFSGMERYQRLEARARQAGTAAASLRDWWDRLTLTMQAPMPGGQHDDRLLALFALPAAAQALTLRSLRDNTQTAVMLARAWRSDDLEERWRPEPSPQLGLLLDGAPPAPVDRVDRAEPLPLRGWLAEEVRRADMGGIAVIDVPALSPNSVRHAVRWGAWLHLCGVLGLAPGGAPGQGPVPDAVEAVFVNGGNIAAGAKQPSDPFSLAWQVRGAYPSLDLLGGVLNWGDLGASRLRVASWLVCRENAPALRGTPAAGRAAARVSAFDLVSEETLTRQHTPSGLGQMLFSFETLAPGTEFFVRFSLRAYTPPLAQGALVAGLAAWLGGPEAVVGGQSARGFGRVAGEFVGAPEGADPEALLAGYEAYLREHAGELLAGLRSGEMTTGKRVLG